jgi:hypothetical protein
LHANDADTIFAEVRDSTEDDISTLGDSGKFHDILDVVENDNNAIRHLMMLVMVMD